MMLKVCHTIQYPPHYRCGVFKEMEKELDCDFYFGDYKPGNIERLDYACLKNHKKDLKNIYICKNIFLQKGLLGLVLKPYKIYICSAEVHNISQFLFMLLLKFFPKKSVYLWGHGCYGKEGKLRFLITKIMVWLSDGFMTYGHYAKDLMIEKGINPKKLEVIYNSLDYEEQRILRAKQQPTTIFQDYFQNNYQTIFFIGRLTKVKALDMLLKSVSQLSQKGVKLNCVFIGGGECYEELVALSIALNIERSVWFYGACHDETIISELIYNADICIAPGNVGLTAMHSLMFGTPVITHNDFKWQMPEFEAIVRGRTGDYFEYQNIDSLTDTIEKWLTYSNENRELIRQHCYTEMDTKWNPGCQVEQMKKMIKL